MTEICVTAVFVLLAAATLAERFLPDTRGYRFVAYRLALAAVPIAVVKIEPPASPGVNLAFLLVAALVLMVDGLLKTRAG